ncbi:hypothetical protein MFIFM68171_05500 [Madurella fahalii]|uniref:Uncharacterized protein n=1 Tax=Madurella fahalii TaxID=1157608 RepID=A0ABQ0GC09_9PEZI
MSSMAKSTTMGALLEPPRTSVHPYPHHHCLDLALQKYLLLHEQHEFLRQHIDELRPASSQQPSIYTPITPSPDSSPTRMSLSPETARHQPLGFPLSARKASCPVAVAAGEMGTLSHESALAEVAVEEAKLCDVNEGMKRALTELLNCETVRGDQAFRTWVQRRLMDTERELRSGRRRRSAPGP